MMVIRRVKMMRREMELRRRGIPKMRMSSSKGSYYGCRQARLVGRGGGSTLGGIGGMKLGSRHLSGSTRRFWS